MFWIMKLNPFRRRKSPAQSTYDGMLEEHARQLIDTRRVLHETAGALHRRMASLEAMLDQIQKRFPLPRPLNEVTTYQGLVEVANAMRSVAVAIREHSILTTAAPDAPARRVARKVAEDAVAAQAEKARKKEKPRD